MLTEGYMPLAFALCIIIPLIILQIMLGYFIYKVDKLEDMEKKRKEQNNYELHTEFGQGY